MRQIEIEGSFNIRDLGGHPAQSGLTREKIFIRAGNLDRVSPEGQQKLIEYGVKTIIDLRDEWEVEHYPDVFAQSTVVKYIHLPLVRQSQSEDEQWRATTDSYAFHHELYGHLLDNCQPEIGAIVAAVADSPSATLFHCYAGKDRTGIIAALLLGAVGVPDSVIAEDYAHTALEIPHLVAEWREYAVQHEEDMRLLERDIGSDAQTIISTLDHLKTRYGGVTNYLAQCGVSPEQIKQLHARWVMG